MKYLTVLLAAASMAGMMHAQQGDNLPGEAGADSLRFTEEEAILFIETITGKDSHWRTAGETVRTDLVRLVHQSGEPFDSVRSRLLMLNLRAVPVKQGTIKRKSETDIRWLNDSTFIIDSTGLEMEQFTRVVQKLVYPDWARRRALGDTLKTPALFADSLFYIPDTLRVAVIDTSALESQSISIYRFTGQRIIPSLNNRRLRRSARVKTDSSAVVFTDSSMVWMADTASPFYFLEGPGQLALLQDAVTTLLNYTEERDSTRLLINDMFGRKIPYWITSGSGDSYRFWVKNYKNDSITLWIGNPRRDEISLLLEDEIDVNRLTREELPFLPRRPVEPPRVLKKIRLLEPVPVYWDREVASVFSFNQTYLANWAKGGENSLSAILDLTGNTTYNNTSLKVQWINSVRINIGTLITQEYGLRKNNDLFEINSQFNRTAWGSQKLDISAIFYMKTQMARGYKYPDDSTVISKFLSPGSLTLGLGVDYKPYKHTSINLAPLSYKNTFVLDTALIDQTRHGVSAGQRARQEMGAQLLIRSKVSPMEDLSIANSVRLFSNYLSHPENIDVDWEMILDKKISWFFTVRLNLHLIYDDDIRFPVLGDDGEPVILPDGSAKNTPKVQFREFVGLSLLFRI